MAVIGLPWSHETLSRVTTHGINLQQVYGESEAALQLEKEAELVKMRYKARNAIIDRGDDGSGVMYSGQAWYGARSPPETRTLQKQNPLSISG